MGGKPGAHMLAAQNRPKSMPPIGSADAHAILDAITEFKELIEPARGSSINPAPLTPSTRTWLRSNDWKPRWPPSVPRSVKPRPRSRRSTMLVSRAKNLGKVTDELDAVVNGTEQATEIILASAETIEENVGNLSAKLDGDDQGMANDAAEAVMAILKPATSRTSPASGSPKWSRPCASSKSASTP